MTVRIKNLTQQPLQVALTSGSSLRLSPGQSSPELHEVEVSQNAKIAKLQAQHLIAVETIQKPAEPKPAANAPEAQAEAPGPADAGGESAGARRAKR
jgi:hypothetical protein